MSLWSSYPGNIKKPNWVPSEEVVATDKGWVWKRPDGIEEVLVSIKNLKTKLGNTVINKIRLKITGTSSKTMRVYIEFSEPVVLTLNNDTPTFTVYNYNQSENNYGNYILEYNSSESKPNNGLLVFKATNQQVAQTQDTLYCNETSLDLKDAILQSQQQGDVINTTINQTILNNVPFPS